MNFYFILIIMDNDAPANPPLVFVQSTDGDVLQTDPAVEVIDSFIEDGWVVCGVGNFTLGNGIYQNILLQPNAI